MKPKIVVIGSANTDLVVQVAQFPTPGETVLGGDFIVAQGGKGANQAVAAARLGADVTFVARLGYDQFGDAALTAYLAEGINTDYIVRSQGVASGVALIMVEQSGENVIAVASGANNLLSPDDVQAAEAAIKQADYLLLQLEIPLETVEAAARLARTHHVPVILNPAPAAPLPASLLERVNILTPNETEAAMLAQSAAADTIEQAGQTLQKQVDTVLVTVGEQGVSLFNQDEVTNIPAYTTDVVDTTAAGDSFNGGLAVALAQGKPLHEAIRYANAVGALTVSSEGAQPSLPTAEAVSAFLAKSPVQKSRFNQPQSRRGHREKQL